MINGERCTRACGFCLIDTRRPLPLDPEEPERVAEAVARMGLAHAVVTCRGPRRPRRRRGAGLRRDDLGHPPPQPGAPRSRCSSPTARATRTPSAIIFEARPDVLNHNLETVNRLQRAVRPSASYARSLSVLARSAAAGLTTKSGIIFGMGETRGRGRGRPGRPS